MLTSTLPITKCVDAQLILCASGLIALRPSLVTWPCLFSQSASISLPFWLVVPDVEGRLFELLMAFDALRLRNVIQLAGILSAFPVT